MIDIAVKLLIAYVIGSVMGSQVAGWFKGVDIRTAGSGNAGATNALRTQGKWFALLVIVIDLGKGALAAGWVPYLELGATATVPEWLPYACGALCVLGHVFPVLYGFRGGKGAATLVGTVLVFAPVLVLPLLAVFILTIALTGFVGLATIVTTEFAAVLIVLVYGIERLPLLVYAVAMGFVIVVTHRENIRRMVDGTESRNTKLMLLKRP
ncbi:MAG: glycerol-3-phosphate 1-O-acyltransferase PlsY [Pseudomonadota bacterium]